MTDKKEALRGGNRSRACQKDNASIAGYDPRDMRAVEIAFCAMFAVMAIMEVFGWVL